MPPPTESHFDSELRAQLEARQRLALSRSRKMFESPQATMVMRQGRSLLNFSSNDYLGLAKDPRLAEAFKRGVDQYGVGSGGSHLVSGHQSPHEALERALADFTGRPRALVFSTGYMANLGVLQALLGKADSVYEDRLNHASLLDGGLASGARFQRFKHRDSTDLARRLAASTERGYTGRKLVVTDGVFSMDGDCADLPRLARVCTEYDAQLMVDDAHGFGVLGTRGIGSSEQQNISTGQLPILMATFGKALGVFGAFVAGSEALIEILLQTARSYIYTTAMPAALAEATRTALRILRQEPERRHYLHQLIDYFRAQARARGLALMPSETPIQPLLVGSNQAALSAAAAMENEGIWICAIRPPTVPKGTARLRLTLSADHSKADIDRLLGALSGHLGANSDGLHDEAPTVSGGRHGS